MAYTTEITDILTKQLEKLSHLNRHQLAGHVPNIDFWARQVGNCMDAIDGYKVRAHKMKQAQLRAASSPVDQVVEYVLDEPAITLPAGRVVPGIQSDELRVAREELVKAWRRLLARLHKEHLKLDCTLAELENVTGVPVLGEDLR